MLLADFRQLSDLSNPRGTENYAIAVIDSLRKHSDSLKVIVLVARHQFAYSLSIFDDKRIFVVRERNINDVEEDFKILPLILRRGIRLALRIIYKVCGNIVTYYPNELLSIIRSHVVFNPSHGFRPQFNKPTVTAAHAILSSYTSSEITDCENNLRKSAAIVVGWPTPFEDFKRRIPLLAEKIFQIPFFTPVIDYSLPHNVKPPLVSLPEKYFFYPSVILERKNHKIIVEGLRILKMAGISRYVVFTGGGASDRNCEDTLHNLVRLYGLEEQVFFLGGLHTSEIAFLYMHCYACICPSFSEAGIATIQEGLLFNKTTLCSDTPEAKSHASMYGLNLCYFDPNSSEDFARALLRLESNFIVYENSAVKASVSARAVDRNYVGRCYFDVLSYAAGFSQAPSWSPYLDPSESIFLK